MAINKLGTENLAGILSGKSSNPQEIEEKTDNYTLAFTDKDRLVTMDAETAKTITIPADATTAFLTGTKIDIANIGTGTLTIAGASGVTLNGIPTILAENQSAQITKLGDNSWIVRGYASFDSPDFTGTVDLPATTNYDGEQLSTTLAAKLPYSYGTATPSTTTDGFLWYDENDTPPTPKFWDGAAFQNVAPAGGLELITSESFSAVSSVSLNGCFTSTYANYRILVEAATSSNTFLRIRLRASGSDDSTSNYDTQLASITSIFDQDRTSDGTSGYISEFSGASTDSPTYSLDVYGPQTASKTNIIGFGFRPLLLSISGFQHTTTTVFDGFTIFLDSGTVSGIVKVYGYKD